MSDAAAPPRLSDADAALVRGIGLWGATLLVIGNVIGSGIFLTTGSMMQTLPSPPSCSPPGTTGGMLAMAGGLTYAEMGSMYPRSGRPLRLPQRGLRAGLGISFRLGLPARDPHGQRGHRRRRLRRVFQLFLPRARHGPRGRHARDAVGAVAASAPGSSSRPARWSSSPPSTTSASAAATSPTSC